MPAVDNLKRRVGCDGESQQVPKSGRPGVQSAGEGYGQGIFSGDEVYRYTKRKQFFQRRLAVMNVVIVYTFSFIYIYILYIEGRAIAAYN